MIVLHLSSDLDGFDYFRFSSDICGVPYSAAVGKFT